MIAAKFQNDAFTGKYFDGNGKVGARLREGYLEVISTAQVDVNDINKGYYPDGGLADQATLFVSGAAHDGASPHSCSQASTAYAQMAEYKDRKHKYQDRHVLDPKDVLAANGYIVNLTTGQGAGYDPVMLANFSHHDFVTESVKTQSQPNLDNADPYSIKIQDGKAISSIWLDLQDLPDKHAFNQEDSNGVGPSVPNTYKVDFLDGRQNSNPWKCLVHGDMITILSLM